MVFFFFFQAEDGIRDKLVTGVQTCALPILAKPRKRARGLAPMARARSALITTAAAAPSLICELLPAVVGPLTWKAGLSLASTSSEVSARGPSSLSKMVFVGFGRAPF